MCLKLLESSIKFQAKYDVTLHRLHPSIYKLPFNQSISSLLDARVGSHGPRSSFTLCPPLHCAVQWNASPIFRIIQPSLPLSLLPGIIPSSTKNGKSQALPLIIWPAYFSFCLIMSSTKFLLVLRHFSTSALETFSVQLILSMRL